MAEKKVKLYGMWASCFSTRVEFALRMKGVEYEYVEEDLQNKSDDVLRYNPVHKKIPVLVHGDKAIAESQVILEYIDETWDSDNPIMPRDPYQRAMARFWAKFIDDKILPSTFKWLWRGDEDAKEESFENMRILDKELEGKKFFGGESIGFLDIVANYIGHSLDATEEAAGKVLLTKETFPSLFKWRDEFLKCSVIQKTRPPKAKLAAYIRDRIQIIKARSSN